MSKGPRPGGLESSIHLPIRDGRMYDLWKSGVKVHAIAARFGVDWHTAKSAIERHKEKLGKCS